jgi:uncharacterized protein (DUF1697 family)
LARYAAFLRAVNLGRNRRVTGAELCAVFEEADFAEAASFRTSGNVVFEAGRAGRRAIGERLEQALERRLGYAVPIYLRTEAELRAIASGQPFDPADVEASSGKLQVALLPRKPPAGPRRRVLALASDDDRLAFGERELYWLPSGGQLESELDLDAIEQAVGPTTRRTMGTIEALTKKFFGD